MTSRVKLFNKQRKIALDSAQWGRSFEALTLEVCKNVLERRPAHLSARHTKSIAREGTLVVELVSNQKIRKLNEQWRGKDYATDVLSFPLIFDGGSAQFMPQMADSEMELGEIIISVEKAVEQANEYGHSFERELAFLFVHGLLHIIGFDHETKEDEREMFSRQTEVLNCLGFVK